MTTEIYTYVSKKAIDKIKKSNWRVFWLEGTGMIKEKYKQLCLSLQFGGIRIMNIHRCCNQLKNDLKIWVYSKF